jgi:2'-5' RNA ligase
VRLFVAVPLPPDIAGAASRVLPAIPALRTVRPEHLHVTLAFLGALPDSRLEDVAGAVRSAAAGTGPFDVALDALGRFPRDGAPRIVWLAVGTGASELITLAERLRQGLAARELPFDAKPFRAHVTLGRVREDADRPSERAIASAVDGARLDPLRFRAERVVVFESVLSPKGPRYTSRAAVPLDAGG